MSESTNATKQECLGDGPRRVPARALSSHLGVDCPEAAVAESSTQTGQPSRWKEEILGQLPGLAKRSTGDRSPSFFNEGELARTSFAIFKASGQRLASVALGHWC